MIKSPHTFNSIHKATRRLIPEPGFLLLCIPLLFISSGCSSLFFPSTREDITVDEEYFTIKKQVIIADNAIYQNNRSGLRVRGSTPVHVTDCDIYQNGRTGINLEQSAEVTIENSNVFKNKTSGISTNNASKVIIRDTLIHQNQNGGIRIRQNEQAQQKSTYVSLLQNKIFLNGEGGVHAIADTPAPILLIVSGNAIYRNRKTGLRIEDNIHLTAKNNKLYSNGTAGIASYVTTELPPKLDIYKNKIYFNLGSGIFIRSGITGRIGLSNNLIYNNYRAGIALGLLNQAEKEQVDVEVFHNTIVGNGSNVEGAGIRNDSKGDVMIKNNIIAYNFTTGIMSDGCGGFSYNLLFANGETSNVKPDSEDFSYLTEKVQYSGCSGRQWGDVLAQPLFFNPDRYNFSLREDSPAINAADAIHSPYFDAFPSTDIGAAPFSPPTGPTQERP